VARLAPGRFHVTTTTGGVSRVLQMMEDYLQTEWPIWRLAPSTTEQWAVVAVQGPLARKVIAPLVEEIDLSAQAMPHMSMREGRIGGVPVRLFASASPANSATRSTPRRITGARLGGGVRGRAGARHYAYGTEAMHVLRAEKGYSSSARNRRHGDVGLGWTIGKAKGFRRQAFARPARNVGAGSPATRRSAD
jgi:sarcosine oxidase subunit alpha